MEQVLDKDQKKMDKSIKWRIAQFMEIRWWRSYLKSKSIEDYSHYKTNYWQKFLDGITSLNLSSNDKILDAGCGPAGIFICLQEYDTTAVDPLLSKYEQDLVHFSQDHYPNTTFIESGLESFESPNRFDHVFCLNCINHVSDLKQSLDNLVNSAKIGGKIYLSIDAHRHQAWKHFNRLIHWDILHPHQYDLEEYTDMLASRGCTIDQTLLLEKHVMFDYYLLVATKN